MKFTTLCYRVVRPIIPYFQELFKGLEAKLKASRINMLYIEYISVALFTALVTSTILSIISMYFLYKYLRNLLASISISLLVFGLTFFIILMLFYLYPLIRFQSIGRKIDNALPFATLYMSGIAGSGAHPLAMFEFLANMEEFGELSKACKEIVYYTKVLGVDLTTALHEVAQVTPSQKFRDLLYSLRVAIIEGGDISEVLYAKTREFIADFRRKITEYSRVVSMLLEVYIILIVVGVLFSLIITTTIGLISPQIAGTLQLIQLFISVIMLPMSSIMFILALKALSPFET